MQPSYKHLHVELPRLVYPTTKEIRSKTEHDDIYVPFKKSVVARKEEVVHVLKSGILERSEWLQARSQGKTPDPVFTNKLTTTALRITADSDVDSRIQSAILKKNVTQKGKTMITEARRNCAMAIDSESQEFLDAMQRDIEVRFPNPSEALLESIEKDRVKELTRIKKRHLRDLAATVARIQRVEQARLLRREPQPCETKEEDIELISSLQACRASNKKRRDALMRDLEAKMTSEMEAFELASKSFPCDVDIEKERKAYMSDLQRGQKEEIKEFDQECARLERPFKAALASHINPAGVQAMVDSYKQKTVKHKEVRATNTDMDAILRYIDRTYAQVHECVITWDSFTDVLRDCLYSTGCQPENRCKFLELATMYARVYTSTHLPKYTLLDKAIEDLTKQTEELIVQARELDRLVAKECRAIKRERTTAEDKPVKTTKRQAEKIAAYEAAVKVALENREKETKPPQPRRTRPK